MLAVNSLHSHLLNSALRLIVKRKAQGDPNVSLARSVAALGLNAPLPYLLARQRWPGLSFRQPHGQVGGEWVFAENSSSQRTILYLHGGGFFFCSPQTHRSITGTLAKMTGCQILALQYRLAPEHPYPAALEDAVAAYRWLLELGHHPSSLCVAGDSAGGGLALATILACKQQGLPLPACVALFSPWTDLAATGNSLESNDRRCVMFSANGIRQARNLYVGEADPLDPLISPLFADLSGLPPLWIEVSDNEVLLDDSTRLAAKARQANVPVELRVWHDLPHVWQLFVEFLPEARQSLRLTADFVHRHLSKSPSN